MEDGGSVHLYPTKHDSQLLKVLNATFASSSFLGSHKICLVAYKVQSGPPNPHIIYGLDSYCLQAKN